MPTGFVQLVKTLPTITFLVIFDDYIYHIFFVIRWENTYHKKIKPKIWNQNCALEFYLKIFCLLFNMIYFRRFLICWVICYTYYIPIMYIICIIYAIHTHIYLHIYNVYKTCIYIIYIYIYVYIFMYVYIYTSSLIISIFPNLTERT